MHLLMSQVWICLLHIIQIIREFYHMLDQMILLTYPAAVAPAFHPLVGDGDGTESLRGNFRSAVTVKGGFVTLGESGGRLALPGRAVVDPLPLTTGVVDITVDARRLVDGDATLDGEANVRGVVVVDWGGGD
jgi:hypothetical protein